MNDIKNGDIVTQNENFYHYWKCEKFNSKVIRIKGKVAYLNDSISIINKTGIIQITNTFNFDYLKINIAEIRKKKLLKINE